ncbi:response regulator transcription factor [Dinghuibacter silviterrae]|uniref:DNA-binding response OmpR family regulator n=1 Tax=Dinghuibacter silviterrae TaxID=1539049 RepID=A0A4R8DPQ7_9BACT|nr:response regulator transcription factor [Dinghuibacter silviterrae]TDW99858.1 DNA-binding response OmpR family regulator [Dinghuibacter silviterrae]
MQPAKIKVLLAEDDLVLGYVIKDNLEIGGYDVTLCPDGEEALQQFGKTDFDICLLDVMMPSKDGFTVAKKIRGKSDVIPILFITSKAMEEDKIKGFQSGADDYIVKPFNMQELILRMEVFLRRTKKLHSEEAVSYQIGKLRFSFTDLKIYVDEQTINLTQKEADLLLFLCKHPNKILKREEVLLNVWGKDDYFLGRSMDVFITKLRKHFKADPHIILETIHGIGFRFNVPEVVQV